MFHRGATTDNLTPISGVDTLVRQQFSVLQVGKGGQQIITSPEEKRDLILLDITNSLFLDPADQRQLTTSNLRCEEQED